MAETKSNPQTRTDSGSALTQPDRGRRPLRRWDTEFGSSPLEFFDRMTEEMDRAFNRIWRDAGAPQRRWVPSFFGSSKEGGRWSPRIESFLKGDQFIVRAELPGLKKDDIEVELTDDALTIHGERREEHQEEREGFFHTEREYGRFHRTIPLPEGVIGESANASFRDGVLEVTMKAPPSEATRGRKLEIRDSGAPHK